MEQYFGFKGSPSEFPKQFMEYTEGRATRKTTLMLIASAMLLECPRVGIIAFVRPQRGVDHASGLVAETARVLRECHNFTDFSVRKESLEIRFSPDDVRTLTVFATNEEAGLRGIGGNVIMMENADFVHRSVHLDIVIPMLAVQGTLLLAYAGDEPTIVNNLLTKL